MPFVRSHDTEIYYESQGEGPAILFAHGGGGNAASWFAQVAHFRASHRCIAFDHRGFGRSRWQAERFEPDLYADDARSVLDALGVERAHVSGLSLGSAVAQEMALRHPDRVATLQLHATWGRADEGFRSTLAALEAPALRGDREALGEVAMRLGLSPAFRATRPREAARLARAHVVDNPHPPSRAGELSIWATSRMSSRAS